MGVKRLSLLTGLIFFWTISQPRDSSAREIFASYLGLVTYNAEELVNFQFAGYTGGSDIGELTIAYYEQPDYLFMSPGTISMPGTAPYSLGGYQFGLQNASGFPLAQYAGPEESSDFGQFFLTYQSILPNGQIDASGGSASGSMYRYGNSKIDSVQFQTVPEPPAIVPAFSAIIITGFCLWMRIFRAGRSPQALCPQPISGQSSKSIRSRRPRL